MEQLQEELARERAQVHDGKEGQKNPMITVYKIVEIGCILGHQVTKRTIIWHLHSNKLFGRVAQRKPLLRTINQTKHLEFTAKD